MNRFSSLFQNLPPLFSGGSTPTRMMVVVLGITILVGVGAVILAIAWVLTPTPTPTPTSVIAKNPPLVFPSPTPTQQTLPKLPADIIPTPTVGQPAQTSPPPPVPTETSSAVRRHVVRQGENLFRISLRYGVPLEDIAAANNIKNISLIYAGQVLIIPNSR